MKATRDGSITIGDEQETAATPNTQHTPGPWEVHKNVSKKGELGIIADSAPCVIAHGMSEKHWPEIANANARLIAAAPELLAKLSALVRRSDNGDTIEPGWYEIAEARAAIAKAEGR